MAAEVGDRSPVRTIRSHRLLTRPLLIAGVLAAAVFSLYVLHIGTALPTLDEDELIISMTAQSLAANGTDLFGNAWPLYMQMGAGSWFCPLIVYAIALVLKILPLSELAVRIPSVTIGVTNVVLMFFIARVLFRRDDVAVLAGTLLALTPSHFLFSRLALEYLYPVPFILGWLLCLSIYLKSGQEGWLIASTVALGFGVFSYIASLIMMPCYLALTGMLLLVRPKPLRAVGLAMAGFLVPVTVLFVPWFLKHPAALGAAVAHYQIYGSSHLDALQGLREMLGRPSIVARATTYWSYLNPSFLFVDLTATFVQSTRTAGVFLAPLSILVLLGFYRAVRGNDPRHLLLAFGFVTAPLAAAIAGEPYAIGRALELIPFGVLVAVVGVAYLWSGPQIALRRPMCLAVGGVAIAVAIGYACWALGTHGRLSASTPLLLLAGVGLVITGLASDLVASRLAVAVLISLGVLQFQHYVSDYFTEYQARASEAFRYNRRGALEYLIARSDTDPASDIYLYGLDRDVNVTTLYWKFYLLKHRRQESPPKTVIIGEGQPLNVSAIPVNGMILARANDQTVHALAASGWITPIASIPEPGEHPFYIVYRRN
jgi:hypothetical protein